MEIELPDGTVLDAPDGSNPSVVAKNYLAKLGGNFNTETAPNPNAIKPGSPQAEQASHHNPQGWVSGISEIGPPTGAPMTPDQRVQSDQQLLDYQAQKINDRHGGDIRGQWMNRPENQKLIRDLSLGTATGLATAPLGGAGAWGPGLLKMGVQSAAQGAAAGASEAIGQANDGGITDPGQLAKTAGYTAAGDLAGGVVLKSLGKIANKIFVSPMDSETSKAAQFASDQGAKFPLSSAMPGKAAGNIQAATNVFLPSQLKNISDARQITTFLNNTITTMQREGSVINDAADSGQKFLRSVFEPGEMSHRQVFGDYIKNIGADTSIPLPNTLAAINDAQMSLARTGDKSREVNKILSEITNDKTIESTKASLVKNEDKISKLMDDLKVLEKKKELKKGQTYQDVYNSQIDRAENEIGRLKVLNKNLQATIDKPVDSMTTKELDTLYTNLRIAMRKGGGGVPQGAKITDAIAKDMDSFGKQYGENFLTDITAAEEARNQWKVLRDVPGLEKLSKEMGTQDGMPGSKAWLDGLFVNPNGKALAKFRELQPDLYHNVADAWLGKEMNRFSAPAKNSVGSVLDGNKLRTWYEANADRIKLIYGAPQAEALDNFSLYAKYMVNSVNKADQPKIGFGQGLSRIAGEAATITGSKIVGSAAIPGMPLITIPTEGAAFLLARGLSDPKSSLFKVFTQGFDPKTRQFMLLSGQMGGREAGRGLSK